MDYLPLLPFLVCMVMVGIIHHRYLRRVEAAYARRGLALPDTSKLPAGSRTGGAWWAFYPLPDDQPDLAEEKRLILKAVSRKTWPVVIICMTLFFTTAIWLSFCGCR
ncbi:hypothetical protein [Prosthecobacter vanneervenii]|uniref:Uncharacterized protein n=1 Tax=Prosthecobacter vanneervenii TaxID=48466 RepID=A0A7W8DMV1_9BACT|nr:hypothetical protein [Prosthecobacter vanneervenii]MBB5035435.1 hypothetical protein [Prosthecobacter vanneervenii]